MTRGEKIALTFCLAGFILSLILQVAVARDWIVVACG